MASRHKRNTDSMLRSQRCGAKTRKGTPCKSPSVDGKKRCRMHGGAPGSGAPKGNKNALKTGMHTAEMKAERKMFRDMMKEFQNSLEALE